MLDHELDITDYLGGDIYVGGFGSIEEDDELPARAVDIVVDPKSVMAMRKLAASALNVSREEDVEILKAGKTYIPVTTYKRPIIAEIPFDVLQGSRNVETSSVPSANHPGTPPGRLANFIHSSEGFIQGLSERMIDGRKSRVVRSSALAPMQQQLQPPRHTEQSKGGMAGGVFLNVGHAKDGIKLCLGSGKVMSELILGRKPSADISGLGL